MNQISVSGFPSTLYVMNGSPTLWEVGQRTYTFLGDYQYQVTPSLHPRDDVLPTAIKQEIRLALSDIGDENLPTWMSGSGNQETGFPDTSPLHALYDLYTDLVPLKTLLDTLTSVGPFGSLLTSYQSCPPRKAFILNNVDAQTLSYQISDTTTKGLFTLDGSGHVVVRPSASFYDFCTAFDPVYISLGTTSSVLLRNLDPVTVSVFALPSGGYSAEIGQFGGSADEPATFIWDDMYSLSDTVSMPQVLAQKPSSAVFDLSGGTIQACISPSGFLTTTPSLTFTLY